MHTNLPKLVLMPGMEGTGELFAGLVRELPVEVHPEIVRYAPDRCESYPDLLRTLESSAPASEPFVLVGESFSSPLAIAWAAAHPPNLKGVVICGGFAASPLRGWLRWACWLLSPVLFLRAPSAELVRRKLAGLDAPATLVDQVRSALGSVRPEVLAYRLCMILRCDVRAELAQVTVPMLFLAATEDELVGSFCLDEMLQIQPAGEVVRLLAPHLLLQREPTRCAALLTTFLERCSEIDLRSPET